MGLIIMFMIHGKVKGFIKNIKFDDYRLCPTTRLFGRQKLCFAIKIILNGHSLNRV